MTKLKDLDNKDYDMFEQILRLQEQLHKRLRKKGLFHLAGELHSATYLGKRMMSERPEEKKYWSGVKCLSKQNTN